MLAFLNAEAATGGPNLPPVIADKSIPLKDAAAYSY